MSVYYKVYGNAADKTIVASSATYATARAATTGTVDGSTSQPVGQAFVTPNYRCHQQFLQFDLSTVPAGAGTTFLNLTFQTLATTGGDTIEIRQASSSANKIAGDSLAALTQVGAFPAQVAATVDTVSTKFKLTATPTLSSASILLMHALEERTNSAPTASTDVPWTYLADYTGTTRDPFLELALPSTQVFLATPGTAIQSYTVPSDWSESGGLATVDAVAPGGAGAVGTAGTSGTSGGGGGGGMYAKRIAPGLQAGTTVYFRQGAAGSNQDTWFNDLNLLLRSQALANAAWTAYQQTATDSQLDYLGGNSASKLVPTVAFDYHYHMQNVSKPASTALTVSFAAILKSTGTGYSAKMGVQAGGITCAWYLDLDGSTGTPGGFTGVTSNAAIIDFGTCSVTALGSGWYEVYATYLIKAADTGTTFNPHVAVLKWNSGGSVWDDSFAGDATNGVWVDNLRAYYGNAQKAYVATTTEGAYSIYARGGTNASGTTGGAAITSGQGDVVSAGGSGGNGGATRGGGGGGGAGGPAGVGRAGGASTATAGGGGGGGSNGALATVGASTAVATGGAGGAGANGTGGGTGGTVNLGGAATADTGGGGGGGFLSAVAAANSTGGAGADTVYWDATHGLGGGGGGGGGNSVNTAGPTTNGGAAGGYGGGGGGAGYARASSSTRTGGAASPGLIVLNYIPAVSGPVSGTLTSTLGAMTAAATGKVEVKGTLGGAGTTPWTPADLTTGQVDWFDASDASTLSFSGSNVTQWRDKSPAANHAVPFASGPTATTVNSLGALTFNGQPMHTTTAISFGDFSWFAVFVPNPQASYERLFDQGYDQGPWIGRNNGANEWGGGIAEWDVPYGVFVPLADSVAGLIFSGRSGSSHTVAANGGTGTTNSPGSTASVSNVLGIGGNYTDGAPTDRLNGDVVCEIVAYSTALSADDRAKVEGYLAHKWGIAGSLPAGHPYKAAAPTTGVGGYELGALTLSATGGLPVITSTGTLSATLGALSLAADADLIAKGTSSITLGALTALGGAQALARGTSTITLDAATVAATGKVLVQGQLVRSFDSLTLSGSGTVFTPAAGEVTGTATITLGALTLAGDADLIVKGTAAATLGTMTALGSGKVWIGGSLAATLGSLTALGGGYVPVRGTASIPLGALTSTAVGKVLVQGHLGGDAAPPWSPADLSGLATWLDASTLGLADGAAVTSWPNPGADSDPTLLGTGLGVPYPVMKTAMLAGKPVVRFTQNEGVLRGTTSVTKNYTLAYITRYWGPLDGSALGRAFTALYPPNFLVGTHGSGCDGMFDEGWVRMQSNYFHNEWRMYEADGVFDGTTYTSRFLIDGVVEGGPVTHGGGIDNDYNLSGHGAIPTEGETSSCDIAEVLLYDRQLTDVERVQVEDYLRAKWLGGEPLPGGDGAYALGALTLSATGTGLSVSTGALTATLGAMTAAGTGTVVTAAATGTLSATLGALTVAGSGAVPAKGTATLPLGALTQAATGKVLVRGTSSAVLGALTVSGAGVVANQVFAGTLSATLGPVGLTGTGAALVRGTLSVTLGAATASATGAVTTPARSGSLNQTLGALTSAATGMVITPSRVGLLNQTLGSLSLTASTTAVSVGSLAQALGALTAAGTGTVGRVGTLSTTLGALTVAATAKQSTAGAVTATLGAATLASIGKIPAQGTLGTTLGTLAFAGSGKLVVTGRLDLPLGALVLDARATVEVEGGVGVTLGALLLAGEGKAKVSTSPPSSVCVAAQMQVRVELAATMQGHFVALAGTSGLQTMLAATMDRRVALQATFEGTRVPLQATRQIEQGIPSWPISRCSQATRKSSLFPSPTSPVKRSTSLVS